jgi:hypothetical protein
VLWILDLFVAGAVVKHRGKGAFTAECSEIFDEAAVFVPRWHPGFELAPGNAIDAHP